MLKSCVSLLFFVVCVDAYFGSVGHLGAGKREKEYNVAQAYREASKLRSLSTYGEVRDICQKTKEICSEMEKEERLKKAEKEMVDDPWDNLKDVLNL